MRVIVVDLGDRIVMRPLVDAPIGDLEGIYAGRGATWPPHAPRSVPATGLASWAR